MGRKITHSLLALVIIAAGVLLLLHNLDIIDFGAVTIWHLFYPAVFIVYGIKVVVDSLLRMKKRGRLNFRWFWGVSLSLAGTLLLLDRFNVIDFGITSVWRLWPLILVYIGLSTLVESDDDWHGQWDQNEVNETHTFGFGHKHVSVGQMKHSGANWSAEPMDIRNAIGDYELDYTRAFIPDENIPVRMSGWVGDVKILVPRDVEFSVNARTLMGDVVVAGQSRDGFNTSLQYKTPGFDEATRKLTFDIFFRILDLRIDHV